MQHVYADAVRHARDAYNFLLNSGVCAEQARAVLPQSMNTEWYWSGSLAAFARVCKLRMSSDAQKETRDMVTDIHREMGRLFPVSWRALCGT